MFQLNIKNNLTVTREEGGEGYYGIMGRGASRNMYEGHMDKVKGGGFKGGRWGWVGRGVENGDNFICITIKR